MKVQVPTKDRRDKREIPHTPCPLVHPFPSLVPTPTSSPPMIHPYHARKVSLNTTGSKNVKVVLPMVMESPVMKYVRTGILISPTKKGYFHKKPEPRSYLITELKTPLRPVILPYKCKFNDVAIAMKAPPIKAHHTS
mmetsp:Transcript_14491/g.10446  ORF Transcript_14491/g.10446 Transcript_14491/m.10446 type:complete len:137 (-) Transcript_14491:13-423(-)